MFYVCVYGFLKFYFFNIIHTEFYELYGDALASPGAWKQTQLTPMRHAGPVWRSKTVRNRLLSKAPAQRRPGDCRHLRFFTLWGLISHSLLITRGLVTWRTGCCMFIVRSSGQTGFNNAQRFFWQTENKQFPYELDGEVAASPDPGYHALPFSLSAYLVLPGKLRSH